MNARCRIAISMFASSLMGLTTITGNAGEKSEAKQSPPRPGDKTQTPEIVSWSIPGKVELADPRDVVRGVPCKVHAVKVVKGMSYVIDMVSTDFDAFLRLEDSASNQLAQDDDGGGNLNSRIRFTASKDDTYLIFAETLGGSQEGQYTLSFRSIVAAPVKTIAMPALAAKKPSEFKGELAQSDPPGPYRDRPAKHHTIDLKAGQTYVIDLVSKDFDAYLLLQDPNGVTLAQDDDGGGSLNSRISFRVPTDGRYRLVGTTFNGQVGQYTLRVTLE